MYFWVPQSGSMGIGVSILSYAGKVFFGVIADTNCVAEPRSLADRFPAEFERLLLATTVGALGLHNAERARVRRPRSAATKKAAGSGRKTARRKTKSPVGNT
jgi:hypothetical protein